MAPEQAAGEKVDRRADTWSFGAVFFEMSAGRELSKENRLRDTLATVMKLDPDWTQRLIKAQEFFSNKCVTFRLPRPN
jgi:serine/threonine protein kinase